MKLTGWARLGNDKSWGMSFECVDANTNKFGLTMRAPGADEKDKFKLSTEWQEFVMEFPKEVNGKDKDSKHVKMPIRYPVKLEPLGTNNWGDKNNPKAVDRMFDLYDLRLWTDMGDIPEGERGYDFDITFPVIGNTFYYGEDKPEVRVSASPGCVTTPSPGAGCSAPAETASTPAGRGIRRSASSRKTSA